MKDLKPKPSTIAERCDCLLRYIQDGMYISFRDIELEVFIVILLLVITVEASISRWQEHAR